MMSKLAGLPPDTPLDVYEEIKFEPKPMVELLALAHTIQTCQLEDGDIIVVQPRQSAVRGTGRVLRMGAGMEA